MCGVVDVTDETRMMTADENEKVNDVTPRLTVTTESQSRDPPPSDVTVTSEDRPPSDGGPVKDGGALRRNWSWLTVLSGWRTYARQSVVFAGISLALLYMTVLGFDSITVGQSVCLSVCLSVRVCNDCLYILHQKQKGGFDTLTVGLLSCVCFVASAVVSKAVRTRSTGSGFDLASRLDSCLPSASDVSLVYLVLYVEKNLITSFSLPFSVLSL